MTDVLAYLESNKTAVAYEPEQKQDFDSVRFTANKQVLLALLDKVSAVIPVKSDSSVILNFKIEVGETLKITGTDGNHTMIVSTKMFEPLANGTMMIPAKIILEILRSVPEAKVDIEVTGSSIIVVIGGASWELRSMQGLKFPPTPSLIGTKPVIIDRKNFLNGLYSVKYAVAKDSARPGLKMINLSQNKMTACDGARFQQAVVKAPAMQIPGGSIDLISKIVGASVSDDLVVAETENELVFKVDKTLLLVEKAKAKFPHAEQLFLRPALANDLELTVSRSKLIAAIKHVRLCADEDTSAIALKLSKDSIEVSTRDQLGNKSKEVIEAGWKGKSRTLTVHHGYLLELLAVNEVDTCKFMLGEDVKSRKSPILLQNEEAGLVGVVQQMLLGSLTGYSL